MESANVYSLSSLSHGISTVSPLSSRDALKSVTLWKSPECDPSHESTESRVMAPASSRMFSTSCAVTRYSVAAIAPVGRHIGPITLTTEIATFMAVVPFLPCHPSQAAPCTAGAVRDASCLQLVLADI